MARQKKSVGAVADDIEKLPSEHQVEFQPATGLYNVKCPNLTYRRAVPKPKKAHTSIQCPVCLNNLHFNRVQFAAG